MLDHKQADLADLCLACPLARGAHLNDCNLGCWKHRAQRPLRLRTSGYTVDRSSHVGAGKSRCKHASGEKDTPGGTTAGRERGGGGGAQMRGGAYLVAVRAVAFAEDHDLRASDDP